MFSNNWDKVLNNIINSTEFINFYKSILDDYSIYSVFPEKENIFKALEITDFNDVKVVILGQDPYFNKGEANGLAFSVNNDVKTPPSLRNIFKEIYRDISILNRNSDLTNWAKQGVLLLNTVLTVRESKPKSYANTYWEIFTDEIIKKLSERGNVIFLLWGNSAISKSKLIDSNNNFILESTHPSPLAAYRGFNGCGHFSKVNKILNSLRLEKIDWSTD